MLRTITTLFTFTALVATLGVSSGTAAAAAVPEYVQTGEYTFDGSNSTGRATATAADTAAFTSETNESVEIVTLDDSGAPVTSQTITPPTSGGSFGIDLALNDDASLLYVAQSRLSQIHVYERDGEDHWQRQHTLTAPETLPERVSSRGANVASAIDVSGDRIVAGVPNARVDGQSNAGFVYVIDLTTDTWEPLIVPEPLAGSIAGEEVAIDGDLVAVGVIQGRNADRERVGGVYLWDLSTDADPLFTQQPETDERVCVPTSGGGPGFGNSLVFTDHGLVVGSPVEINYIGDDPNATETGCTGAAVAAGNTTQGAVYVFDDQLQQIGPKLLPPLRTTDFGASLGASGDTLVVRGWQGGTVGAAHVYDLTELDRDSAGDENGRQRPEPVQSLSPEGSIHFARNSFGTGISVAASQVVVGSTGAPSAVHIFGTQPAPEPVVLGIDDATIVYGQPVTLQAIVESGDLPDGAEVKFNLEGEELGRAPIEDGVASIVVEAQLHNVGTYQVTVESLDENGESLGEAASAQLTVTPAATETDAQVVNTSEPGVSVTVTGEHGTVPTGDIEIRDGEETVATIELEEGAVEWDAPAASDDVTYGAYYLGDDNHLASEATVTISGTEVPGDESEPQPVDPDAPEDSGDAPEDSTNGVELSSDAIEDGDSAAQAESETGLASTGASLGTSILAALAVALIGAVLFTLRRHRA